MPIDLSFISGCSTSGSCGGSGYFLGSSRTYTYYATWFKDPWQFPIPPLSFFADAANVGRKFIPGQWNEGVYNIGWVQNFTPNGGNFKPDNRCIGAYATSNMIDIGRHAFAEKPDYICIQKNIDIISNQINEISHELVKFRDNGTINSVASPLFLSFWIGGCGSPCYPCAYEGVNCGYPFSMMYEYTDNMDQYWDINNEDHCPYFNTGFVLDYYGRIDRGPEPSIGWFDYVFGDQSTCQYCHCIAFCILKQCIDGWFATRHYHSKIFLFDANGGIPYRHSGHIANFASEVNESYTFGKLDIKLNHLADEGLFVGGFADHQHGNIELKKDEEGYIDKNTINLYGKYIPGITEFDYYEAISKFDSVPEASFTTGNGSSKIEISSSIRGADQDVDGNIIIPDLAVRYKTEQVMPEITGYGWIYVDIPEEVQEEWTWLKFTMDGGNAWPSEINGECNPTSPALGCDLPLTISSQKLNRFYVRSTREDPEKLMEYWSVPSQLIPGPSVYYLPKVIQNGPTYDQKYYKRYIKKIVKAPYNLYVKSGESQFRTCKLGETLKKLEPGRYYFPNPVQCKNHFEFPNLSSMADESLIPVDQSEEAEFRSIFNINLNQFLGPMKENDTLSSRYNEAIRILGKPDSNAIRMELTEVVKYTPPTQAGTSADLLANVAELAKNGQLDPNTVAKLKEAGLI